MKKKQYKDRKSCGKNRKNKNKWKNEGKNWHEWNKFRQTENKTEQYLRNWKTWKFENSSRIQDLILSYFVFNLILHEVVLCITNTDLEKKAYYEVSLCIFFRNNQKYIFHVSSAASAGPP